MDEIFRTKGKIRFADCDVAGIVFYPRYFEMVNGVVEDWFADELDCSFATMHRERNQGLPTVSVDCEFVAPSRIGDVLDFELKVLRLGTSSMTLSIAAFNEGVMIFKTRNVLVCVSLDKKESPQQSVEIPTTMRERIRPFIASE